MQPITVTFLGTSSALPSLTRNTSSLAIRLPPTGQIWLFDCGEATQHQIQKSNVRLGKLNKIFITHMHGDHCFGLAPLMATLLQGHGGEENDVRVEESKGAEPLEIYGLKGLRMYIRAALILTYTNMLGRYVVHELHFANDDGKFPINSTGLHHNELPGRDIIQSKDGFWHDIFKSSSFSVSAGAISHSVPSLGFVIREPSLPGKIDPKFYLSALKQNNAPKSFLGRVQRGETIALSDGTVLAPPKPRVGRKIVICGDTNNASALLPLATQADCVIHEATNAHIGSMDGNSNPRDIQKRTVSRGHSTPEMAGAFAAACGARVLLLNHFSARYADERDKSANAHPGMLQEYETEGGVMVEIANQARSFFPSGIVACARDLWSWDVVDDPSRYT